MGYENGFTLTTSYSVAVVGNDEVDILVGDNFTRLTVFGDDSPEENRQLQ